MTSASHQLPKAYIKTVETTLHVALCMLDVPSPDGWLMARNAAGTQGLVPESFLRLKDDVPEPQAPAPSPHQALTPRL